MDWKIPLFKIYWDDEDIEVVKKSIQRGMNWAAGPNIEKFERMSRLAHIVLYIPGRRLTIKGAR